MEVRILGEYVGLGERAIVLSVVFVTLGLRGLRFWWASCGPAIQESGGLTLFISYKYMQDAISPMALNTALITAHCMKYRFPAMGSWTRFHNEIEYEV